MTKDDTIAEFIIWKKLIIHWKKKTRKLEDCKGMHNEKEGI